MWSSGAVTPRAAAILISTVATVITVGAGIIMTVADHHNFPSIGAGLWWSVQTVTTVGYGDHVPITIACRLVAALVMLVGVSFLTVITASITSAFVDRSRREHETPDACRGRPRPSCRRSTAGSSGSRQRSAHVASR